MIREPDDALTQRDRLSNDQLRGAVCERLGDSSHRELRGVIVTVDNNRVVLSGTVASFYLKQIAQETARKACPERKVYNDLDVAQAPT